MTHFNTICCSGDADDMLKVKRVNHDLSDDEEERENPTLDLENPDERGRREKKPLTKAALAKRLMKKKIVPNRQVCDFLR